MNAEQARKTSERVVVNCDQEAWLKDRVATAIRMALKVKREAPVRADESALNCALEGIINGTVVEIIHTLGMEPEWINLRRPMTLDAPNLGGMIPGERL